MVWACAVIKVMMSLSISPACRSRTVCVWRVCRWEGFWVRLAHGNRRWDQTCHLTGVFNAEFSYKIHILFDIPDFLSELFGAFWNSCAPRWLPGRVLPASSGAALCSHDAVRCRSPAGAAGLCWWWPQPGPLSRGALTGVVRRRAAVAGRTSCRGDRCRAQRSISFGWATASHLVSSLARTERKEFDCSGSEIAQVPVCPFQSLFWKQLLHLQLHTSTVTGFITFSSCSLFPRFICIIFLDESWFQM